MVVCVAAESTQDADAGRLRILLAEANPRVLSRQVRGLRNERDLAVVGAVDTAATMHEELARLAPDVLVVDAALAAELDMSAPGTAGLRRVVTTLDADEDDRWRQLRVEAIADKAMPAPRLGAVIRRTMLRAPAPVLAAARDQDGPGPVLAPSVPPRAPPSRARFDRPLVGAVGVASVLLTLGSGQPLWSLGALLAVAYLLIRRRADGTSPEPSTPPAAAVVLAAEAAERGRLAARLHDGPMQLVMVAAQEIRAAEEGEDGAIGLAREMITEASAELRLLLSDQRTDRLVADIGLEAGLALLIGRHTRGGSPAHHIDVETAVPAALAPLVTDVVSEAVVNAVKHADAETIRVTVRRERRRAAGRGQR